MIIKSLLPILSLIFAPIVLNSIQAQTLQEEQQLKKQRLQQELQQKSIPCTPPYSVNSILSAANEKLNSDIGLVCYSAHTIALLINEVDLKGGIYTIDQFKTKGNYTLDQIIPSGMGSQWFQIEL